MPHFGRFIPSKEIHYPLYGRLDEPPRPPEWVWNISSPPGFEPTFTDQHKLSLPRAE